MKLLYFRYDKDFNTEFSWSALPKNIPNDPLFVLKDVFHSGMLYIHNERLEGVSVYALIDIEDMLIFVRTFQTTKLDIRGRPIYAMEAIASKQKALLDAILPYIVSKYFTDCQYNYAFRSSNVDNGLVEIKLDKLVLIESKDTIDKSSKMLQTYLLNRLHSVDTFITCMPENISYKFNNIFPLLEKGIPINGFVTKKKTISQNDFHTQSYTEYTEIHNKPSTNIQSPSLEKNEIFKYQNGSTIDRDEEYAMYYHSTILWNTIDGLMNRIINKGQLIVVDTSTNKVIYKSIKTCRPENDKEDFLNAYNEVIYNMKKEGWFINPENRMELRKSRMQGK